MKTRNTKKKTVGPKAVPPKKKPGNDPAWTASAKKKVKTAGKASTKSAKKEKKSSVLKKPVKKPLKAKKDLPVRSAKATKKASVSKSPAKSAKVKAKKVKKKITKPEPLSKKGKQKAPESALPKALASLLKKISPVTRRKIIKKVKKTETPVSKKTKGPGIKPAQEIKMERIKKLETGPEEKKGPIPKSKEVLEHVSPAELPEEYGENELILIAVDPNMVFVDWEISKKEASRTTDGFTMRIFNVSGGKPLRLPQESFVDIKIKDRIGRAFFELGMPGRKVAVEIGYYENRKFLPVLRASAISMPRLLTIDELGIAQKLFESGIPVGY